jgi:hypothetical protein
MSMLPPIGLRIRLRRVSGRLSYSFSSPPSPAVGHERYSLTFRNRHEEDNGIATLEAMYPCREVR